MTSARFLPLPLWGAPSSYGAGRAFFVRRALLGVGALLVSCGPASPDPVSPPPTASASAPTEASPGPTAGATADPVKTAEPVATAPAPKPGVPVESSPPPGTKPLDEAESKELTGKCKKLMDVIASTAKKDGGKKRPIDYAMDVVAHPPKLAGVDVPRCGDLVVRDMIEYLARTRENEAKLNLKRILVGLMMALERDVPVLCSSAPAVPPDLATVKDVPYASTGADWKAPGWTCARFDLSGGQQVFQYELRSNAAAKTFEVIARGYPVQGAPPTELYVAGRVESGAIDPSTPVMRRP